MVVLETRYDRTWAQRADGLERWLFDKEERSTVGFDEVVLQILDEEPISVKEVSLRTGLALSTLTNVFDKMEEKRLGQRRHSRSDRRRMKIELDVAGRNHLRFSRRPAHRGNFPSSHPGGPFLREGIASPQLARILVFPFGRLYSQERLHHVKGDGSKR